MLNDTRAGYGSISILLHWAAAAAIIYLWVLGKTMEHDQIARATHIAMGSGLAILLLARVLWRAFSVNPKPLGASTMLNVVASLVKVLLLLDIVLVVASGFLSVWLRGRAIDVFGLLTLPSPLTDDRSLAHTVSGLHEFGANAFLFLVGLHVLGALKHLVWDRDGTLKRMLWPRRIEA